MNLVEFLGHVPFSELHPEPTPPPPSPVTMEVPSISKEAATTSQALTSQSLFASQMSTVVTTPEHEAFVQSWAKKNQVNNYHSTPPRKNDDTASVFDSDNDSYSDDGISSNDDQSTMINPCTGLPESSSGSGIDVGGQPMYTGCDSWGGSSFDDSSSCDSSFDSFSDCGIDDSMSSFDDSFSDW